MSLVNLQYPLTDGTFAYGSQVYANLTQITSVVNGGLDSSNVNLSRGIGANYIVASGSGASGVFQAGSYSFTPASTGGIALSINGLAGQTVNIFQVSTSTAPAVWVDQNGVLNTSMSPVFGGSTGYVQLSPSSQQSGAISISGNATIGGNIYLTGGFTTTNVVTTGALAVTGNANPPVGATGIVSDGSNGYIETNTSGASFIQVRNIGGGPCLLEVAGIVYATGAVAGNLNFNSGAGIQASTPGGTGAYSWSIGSNATGGQGDVSFVNCSNSSSGFNGGWTFWMFNGSTYTLRAQITSDGSASFNQISATSTIVAAGNVGTSGGGILGFNGSFSSPGGSVGDAVFQRSANTGKLWLGGASGNLQFDFNLTYGGQGYINESMVIGGNVSAIGAVGGTVITASSYFAGSGAGLAANSIPNAAIAQTPNVAYNSSGTPIAVREVHGTTSVAASSPVVVTLPFAYSGTGSYRVLFSPNNPGGVIANIVKDNAQQFTIYVNGTGPYTVDWVAVGN